MDLKDLLFGKAADPNSHPIRKVDSFYDWISLILPNVYIVAGFILFIYLVVGGFFMITSAGNTEATKNGQKILTNAIIGFAVLFASYWLIQIIEVVTGIPILHPPTNLIP